MSHTATAPKPAPAGTPMTNPKLSGGSGPHQAVKHSTPTVKP
jgi:hypothetical protein